MATKLLKKMFLKTHPEELMLKRNTLVPVIEDHRWMADINAGTSDITRDQIHFTPQSGSP